MRKPLIGINSDLNDSGKGHLYRHPYLFVYTNYFDAITRAGGIPVLLPFLEDDHDVVELIGQLDGLLLIGCLGDIDQKIYQGQRTEAANLMPERRQNFDLKLIKQAMADKELPVLAICSGVQLLNVACGGSLHQDITDCGQSSDKHMQLERSNELVHPINADPNSRLGRLLQAETLGVNSMHHQAIAEVASGFKVSARADDGVIEAIEFEGDQFLLGVQWHPERLPNETIHQRLFQSLVEQASQ
jgi:putative glutamine amidotransferase